MQKPVRNLRDLRPALVFLNGDLIAVPIPLERETVILGKALEADVRVNDAQTSRRHATITTQVNGSGDKAFILNDLGSRNGTFVNGEKVSEAVLHHGDKITVGEQIFR